MLDCLGNELQVGDKIIAAAGKSAELLLGEITGFTDKKIKLTAVLASMQDNMQPIEYIKYPWQVYKR